jgi:D-alanine-D-alanine ligase-like ATP-grasp enzyme
MTTPAPATLSDELEKQRQIVDAALRAFVAVDALEAFGADVRALKDELRNIINQAQGIEAP